MNWGYYFSTVAGKKKNGPHTTVFQRVPLSGAARALPARAAYSIPDLPTWHTPRVVLIGDAAHGLPPNGGMGFGVGCSKVEVGEDGFLGNRPSEYKYKILGRLLVYSYDTGARENYEMK
ncbi:hypothetical protein C8J57DRAFT_1644506 [Mycena rebaudengoi]|nr:hypothetical protein C8J57DRAFT_1644506 [Mycena rebaudengoi]